MNKKDAILRIKDIQSGGGDSFKRFPNELKGRIAIAIENNTNSEMKNYDAPFGYGFEYGEIWGLMKAFDIEESELR